MKTKIILSLLISIFVISCNQEKSKPIEGTWNLVYAQSIQNDTLRLKFPDDFKGSQMKIWCKKNWAFVGKYMNDTTSHDNYGGGTYTIDGTHYQETIVYHAAPSTIGSAPKMLIEIKGDSLIQVWPVDESWHVDMKNYWVEKYIRVK